MIEGEDARRVNRICNEAIEYLTAIAKNCGNLHWTYLAEKTEKAQSCMDVLRGYYEEYREADKRRMG